MHEYPLVGMVISPGKTMRVLPSDKIISLSLFVAIAMWTVPLIQSVTILNELSFDITLLLHTLLPVVFTILIIPCGALFIFNLAGNKLTLFKLINLFCASQMPSISFVILTTMLYLTFPKLSGNGQVNKLLNFIVLLLTGYSYILFIYGAIICNPKKKAKNLTRC